MHISKLRLRGWRNFKEIEAHLRPRVFVLGPNAVGKDSVNELLDIYRNGAGGG